MSRALGIDLLWRRRLARRVAAWSGIEAATVALDRWLVLAGTPNQASLPGTQQRHLLGSDLHPHGFYIQRLPDQLTGPLVEIGTVFGGSR